jgi:hypothetical protein
MRQLGKPDDPRLVKFARGVNSLEALEPAVRTALARRLERDDPIARLSLPPDKGCLEQTETGSTICSCGS